MVNDVQESIDFYTRHFGFELRTNAVPAFADVVRGGLRLLLAGPKSSAGRPMPDGRSPGPAAGTGSTSLWRTSPARWNACATRACAFATTSSQDQVVSRS